MNSIPSVQVGIQFKKEIEFTLSGLFQIGESREITGSWRASLFNDKLKISNGLENIELNSGVIIEPVNPEDSHFTLHDVTIGINFHWERAEDQSFKGSLKLFIENNSISAINILPVEDYLKSVISSEMSATSSLELLKAHAVISRSWLLAQIDKNKSLKSENVEYQSVYQTESELIKWYDREDHVNFDVCADDHCQRYQGITRSTTKDVEVAVDETLGEVLSYDGTICDARFSKCCGGMTEVFEDVWEPVNHPYLQAFPDNESSPDDFDLNIKDEAAAEKWMYGRPDAFCNTDDKEVLSQVLNDYDLETNDFYRWTVSYSQKVLSELVKERSGIDFGLVKDLIPVERGNSGRIIKLKIVGEKRTLTIGKELEIRKILSKSHLYSSAFVVEKAEVSGKLVFVLWGAGWGHGVGLCQIGAAVMGSKGYSYKDILIHYYRDAQLEKKY